VPGLQLVAGDWTILLPPLRLHKPGGRIGPPARVDVLAGRQTPRISRRESNLLAAVRAGCQLAGLLGSGAKGLPAVRAGKVQGHPPSLLKSTAVSHALASDQSLDQ